MIARYLPLQEIQRRLRHPAWVVQLQRRPDFQLLVILVVSGHCPREAQPTSLVQLCPKSGLSLRLGPRALSLSWRTTGAGDCTACIQTDRPCRKLHTDRGRWPHKLSVAVRLNVTAPFLRGQPLNELKHLARCALGNVPLMYRDLRLLKTNLWGRGVPRCGQYVGLPDRRVL